MSSEDIRAGIEEIIREFGAPVGEITSGTRFREDLEMDSLTTIELFTAAERRFDTVIPDAEVGKIHTVGELQSFVARQTAA